MRLFWVFVTLFARIDSFSLNKNIKWPSNNIFSSNNNIKMSYDKFKNYDEKINIIPAFQANILINNWISFINHNNDNNNYDNNDNNNYYNNDNNDNNNDNNYDNNDYNNNYNNDCDNDNISENIKKAIYDMKFFISLNKQEKNTILFAWCPEYYTRSRSVVYIVAGKNINNTIYVHRIAQNPYYENIINIRSIDFVKDLNEVIEKNNFLKDVNYDELHKYDNRYLLSWNTLLI